MKKRLVSLISAAFSLIGLLLVIADQDNVAQTQRMPASLNTKDSPVTLTKQDLLNLKDHHHDHLGSTFKNQGPLSLQFTETIKKTSEAQNHRELTLTLSASEDINQPIALRWQIPDGVAVLSSLETEILQIKPGQILNIKLQFVQNQEKLAPLRVVAVGGQGDYGYSAEAAFDFNHQSELDEQALALSKRAKAYMKQQPTKLGRLQKFNVVQ